MEAIILPLRKEPNVLYRYSRNRFIAAGVCNFDLPPAQNQDRFEICLNVMPTITGVFLRRWGYRIFQPKLDSGASPTDDSL
jgi:hypothetical protein